MAEEKEQTPASDKRGQAESLKDIAEEENIGAFRIDSEGAIKLMANEILGVPTYVKVGHKNGNPFDNRKCNLFIIDPDKGKK